MTNDDAYDLLEEYGRWSRLRPEGAYRPPMLLPAFTRGYMLTDEEGMTADKVVCGMRKRAPKLAQTLIYRFIYRMTYRQIAHEFNMSKYTISKQLDLAISSFRISYEAHQHAAKR